MAVLAGRSRGSPDSLAVVAKRTKTKGANHQES